MADEVTNDTVSLLVTGLAINLGNPKAMVFFLALLPTAVPTDQLTALGVVILASMVALVITCVFTGYALAAARARCLFMSPAALRRINRSSAVVLVIAAIAICIG